MELHTFFFTNLHEHGDCFASYLALRKRLFVDDLGWKLAHDGKHEMDQYDHPRAAYSIVTLNGRAVAGGRALSCASEWLGWTYMLNDAHRGLLEFIPESLMCEYPADDTYWECTRLVVDDKSLTASERAQALKAVVFGLCDITASHRGRWLVSLSPVSFGRLLRSMGYDASPFGKRYRGVEDGRYYRPFRMASDVTVNEAIGRMMVPGLQVQPSEDGLLDRLLSVAA